MGPGGFFICTSARSLPNSGFVVAFFTCELSINLYAQGPGPRALLEGSPSKGHISNKYQVPGTPTQPCISINSCFSYQLDDLNTKSLHPEMVGNFTKDPSNFSTGGPLGVPGVVPGVDGFQKGGAERWKKNHLEM